MKKPKEEKFLLKLYDLALLKGGTLSPIDSQLVGKAMGLGVSSLSTIIN